MYNVQCVMEFTVTQYVWLYSMYSTRNVTIPVKVQYRSIKSMYKKLLLPMYKKIRKSGFLFTGAYCISLGNPSRDRQQFVHAIVLITAPDWSKGLSNVVKMRFESVFECRKMLGFPNYILQ